MKATPENIMTLVRLYTGLNSSYCLVLPRKWSFNFYSGETLLEDDFETDSAGFDMTPELAEDLTSIIDLCKAAAKHVQCELQRPKELRRRVFKVNSKSEYIEGEC